MGRDNSHLLIDSATDENKVNSPIKVTQQRSKEKVVYLSRTRKGTMRSKMVIDKINDMKMNLDNKVTLRKTEKTKGILSLQRRLPTQLNES